MGASYDQIIAEAGPKRSRDELDELYGGYEAEGHLVRMTCDTPHDPDANSWLAWCTCGDSSGWPEDGPRQDEEVILRAPDDARWWARGHRSDQGLAWQELIPNLPLGAFYAGLYRGDAHCVVGGPIEASPGVVEWIGWCTCTDELEDPSPDAMECRAWRGSEEELLEEGGRHRQEHGLDPQAALIHPSLIYRADPADLEAEQDDDR